MRRARLLARSTTRDDATQPFVHQCIQAYVSKLFSLSFGLASVDVHSANPADHFVHRGLHRMSRGALLALGLPDGRLRSLVDHECAAILAAFQAKSVSHWGVGAELVTLGHHGYKTPIVDGAVILPSGDRPKFLSEVNSREMQHSIDGAKSRRRVRITSRVASINRQE